jgi:membrane fusion protein (multidrug efflux system)
VSIRRIAFAPLAAALALAAACSRGGEQAAFTPPPAEVAVVTAAPRDVALPYEYTARVEGSREVEIRARVSGTLLRRAFDEGRPVRKGQLLFEIDPAPYRAEVQTARALLAEAEARRARADREAARLRPLLAERAVSQKAYDDAVSESEQAHAFELAAQARLARAEVDLSYTRVTAPIAGLSSRAVHSEGSLVEPGDEGLLTRLSQIEPIWVRFSVPDRTLLELRRGIAEGRIASPAPTELEVEIVLADGSLHPERGRVNFADSRIDAATGAVDLRAELPNAGGALVPGQFVRARLLGVTQPGAIVVPQRAVLQGQQGKFVYVVAAGDTVELRPVEVGGWVGDGWIVESGLVPGDRVVVDGTSKVRPGAPVTVAAEPAAAPEN